MEWNMDEWEWDWISNTVMLKACQVVNVRLISGHVHNNALYIRCNKVIGLEFNNQHILLAH